MTLQFHLEYVTSDGQQMAVNLPERGQEAEKVKTYLMETHDGSHWSCEIEWESAVGSSIDYYYTVMKDGKAVRKEWGVVGHRLELNVKGAACYRVYDQWIDLPEDAHLYTSAVTDCVVGRTIEKPKVHSGRQTLRLKVRAPQLRRSEWLGIIGADPQLGAWQAKEAVPMQQHQINEWMVDLDVSKLSSRQLEFKFVALDAVEDVTPFWEQYANRYFSVPEMADGDVFVCELPQAVFEIPAVRCAGTLVPVFSLRSKESFGIGDFGDLRKMVNWVALTGQRVLQVLPINDTTSTHTWIDSYPYNGISIFALHPLYADLTQLPPVADKKLKKEMEVLRKELNALPQVDYERVEEAKTRYLHAIYEQEGAAVLSSKAFKAFFKENEHWLVPYALYSHLRDLYGTGDFNQWEDHRQWDEGDRAALCNPRTRIYKEVAYYYYVQFILSSQLTAVHDYARSHGVILKGDIPIGVNRYGCDAWAEPRYFNMNGQAGAPPDEFSVDGQNWGFPTYNWDEMMKDDCAWWVRRFQNMAHYFDAYRIDHVLGFFRIWEIPVPETSGLMGQFSPALGLTEDELRNAGFIDKKELFLQDHRDSRKWHPRIAVQYTDVFKQLPEEEQAAFNRLYDDYFYHRNNQFWYQEAMKKLPKLVNATRMLVCAEDLGMVPECVPWVINELKILSLELQSMPKEQGIRFGHLSRNPYRSVCTISSHDMPTLRQWWDEDEERTQDYYATMLHRNDPAPHPLPGWLARDIVSRHLTSPSMLCILSIQDWMAIDEKLRLPDANAERINIPANPRHYWRYRMHLNIEDLLEAQEFNSSIKELVLSSGRK